MNNVSVLMTALVGVLGAFGIRELVMRWVTRRGDRADAVRQERKEVSVVEAEGNLSVLKELMRETRDRVNGYEASISQMKADHAADISELKTENRTLERAVADLRLALQEYQLGNRVPRGMVLVPVTEIKRIRETNPGLLMQRWYPGELESGDAVPPLRPSITAQITRLDDGA